MDVKFTVYNGDTIGDTSGITGKILYLYAIQCCSCHATPQDGVLPGRSNRLQSPAGPVNMRLNMRRCSL